MVTSALHMAQRRVSIDAKFVIRICKPVSGEPAQTRIDGRLFDARQAVRSSSHYTNARGIRISIRR